MITTVTFCTGQSSHSSPILSRSFDERIRMSKRYFGGDSMWNVTMINFLRKSISPGPIQGLTRSCRQDLEEIKVQVLPESAFALEGEMIFHHRLILHEKLIWNKSWANLERVLWLSKRFRKDQPIISLNFPSLWSILFKESTTSEAVWTLHPFKSPGQLGFCKSNGPLLNAHLRFS